MLRVRDPAGLNGKCQITRRKPYVSAYVRVDLAAGHPHGALIIDSTKGVAEARSIVIEDAVAPATAVGVAATAGDLVVAAVAMGDMMLPARRAS